MAFKGTLYHIAILVWWLSTKFRCLALELNLSKCDLDKFNLDLIYIKLVCTTAGSNCF